MKMRRKCVNLIITGVGGQGILALSRVIGEAAMKEGYQAKIAEVHGMAQRGGSLVTQVRIGEGVKSPLIPKFTADLLVSMEVIESIRYLEYLKPNGHLVLNRYMLVPTGIQMALTLEDLLRSLTSLSDYKLLLIDAYEISSKLGETRVANMVIFGFLLGGALLPISKNSAIEAMKTVLPPKFELVNIKAFNEGYKVGLSYRME